MRNAESMRHRSQSAFAGLKRPHTRHCVIAPVLCTYRTLAHADGARICARATQRARLLRLVENHMQCFTCFALAFHRHTRGICARVCNTGKRDCEENLSSAELLDGTRPRILALNHAGSPSHIVHQRTLTRNGDVPISSSVQDFCDSWKNHMQSFTCFADALAFRGRSPSVTKSSTHPSVPSVKNHMQSIAHWQCFTCFALAFRRHTRGICARVCNTGERDCEAESF